MGLWQGSTAWQECVPGRSTHSLPRSRRGTKGWSLTAAFLGALGGLNTCHKAPPLKGTTPFTAGPWGNSEGLSSASRPCQLPALQCVSGTGSDAPLSSSGLPGIFCITPEVLPGLPIPCVTTVLSCLCCGHSASEIFPHWSWGLPWSLTSCRRQSDLLRLSGKF